MNLLHRLKLAWRMKALELRSICHNSARTSNHYTDALFEPVFWFVDKFSKYLGVIFVILVSCATTSIVVLWYLLLFPLIQTYGGYWPHLHVMVGHWLLINITFHYFKAVTTDGGTPPQGKPMDKIQGAMVCKKCIQPKPPRTHHCSICNRCVLKMDHHCPWMNNCIGFYNHRYFILFCIYMWIGTIYVVTTSYRLFYYHFFHPGSFLSSSQSDHINSAKFMLPGYGVSALIASVMKKKAESNSTEVGDALQQIQKKQWPHPGGFAEIYEWEHVGIIWQFLVCLGVSLALGLLTLWHCSLISRGETSIEVHVNSGEEKKAAMRGMGYNNQNNFGFKQNWKNLLGLYHGRSFMWVLLPSAHKPRGDGITWDTNGKCLHYPDALARARLENKKDKKYWWCPC